MAQERTRLEKERTDVISPLRIGMWGHSVSGGDMERKKGEKKK